MKMRNLAKSQNTMSVNKNKMYFYKKTQLIGNI